MMCSIFESIAYNVRETDDLLNPVGAGALTGVIYKITSVRSQTLCPGRTGHAARAPSPSAPHSVTSTRSHPDASSRLGLSARRALSGPENRALRRARIGSDGCRRVIFDQAVLVAGVAQELSLRHPQARRIGGDWQRSSSVPRNIGAQVGAAL